MNWANTKPVALHGSIDRSEPGIDFIYKGSAHARNPCIKNKGSGEARTGNPEYP